MNEYGLARALHVLGVVLWIGGVAMVTTVLLPAAGRFKTQAARVEFFEEIERGFASQARLTTLIVGASGFYLVHRLDLWQRFAQAAYWWMHAMVAVWAIYTLVLFVLEPLVLHHWFLERARRAPEETFRMVTRFHRVLLALSLVAVAGAVAGSHGGFP